MKNIIACKTNPYVGFTPEETFNGLAKSGFKYIELSASPNCNSGVSRFSPKVELEALKNKLNDLGLIVLTLSGHTNVIDSTEEDFINNLKLAKYFGAKYFVASVGDVDNPKEPLVKDEEVATIIKKYIPYLEEYDLIFAIELHGAHARGTSVNNIVKLVNSPRVKINYDTGNAIMWAGLTVDEMIKDFEECVDNIAHVHIKDKLGEIKEWNFPAIGDGYVPFDKVFEILKKNNNTSPLMVEVEYTPKGISDVKIADEAVIKSYKFLKELTSK